MIEKIIVITLLASLMLQAGLEVNRDNLLAALKDRGMLARAFLANFIIVPLIAFAVVRLLGVDEMIGTGILLMSIAPGVPFLPMSAGRKKGGSTGFAICLAFLMPALSIITAPITAQLVLPADALVNVKFASFVISLVIFQLIPLLVGMAIHDRAPALAEKLAKVAAIVFLLSVVAVLFALGSKVGAAFVAVFGSRGLLAALAVVVLSALTGWILGGSNHAYRDTLSIATVLRNPGLATLIATQSFPGTVVPASVLTYLVIQFLVATLIGVAFKRSAAA